MDTTTDLQNAERYVPPSTRENYEARVEAGTDTWPGLARQFAVDGQTRLAEWAGLRAGTDARSEPPRRRGRPPREVA
jgi:hypothetical protein